MAKHPDQPDRPNEPDGPDEPDPKEFELDAPAEPLAGSRSDSTRAPFDPQGLTPLPPPPEIEKSGSQKSMSWKGFEEEEEYEPELTFPPAHDTTDDEMDMTPMVDVTFLLLIFFMVTASFASQRAQEPPPSINDLPSPIVEDFEDQNDYVEVIVDQNNTYRITSRDLEEIEAPSDTQMRAEMRNAKDELNARKLLITAHENAWHERVVKVIDYGHTLGFDEIQAQTTNQEY
jgi:biopolymer transport protein ExbD